jgi:PPOX class probable F420-dependent enzyme
VPATKWRDPGPVTLDEYECWARLVEARHGVLATVHPDRGVDTVPVVFAVVDGLIVVPIDTVKPKRHFHLARMSNLTRDPRCVLLVDHFDEDWSRLWWVRVHAQAEAGGDPGPWIPALADRYPQYRPPGTVVEALVLRPTVVSGWAAG